MKLHLIKYNTMNSWNNSTAPAFNLKVYNVIPQEYRGRVYEVIQTEEYWDEVRGLISNFQVKYDYLWQAGFNGRSGGYLVLYRGGKNTEKITEKDFEKNDTIYVRGGIGWKSKAEIEAMGLMNKTITTRIYTLPGKSIDFEEVPKIVLDDFKQLAINIVKLAIDYAKNYEVVDEEYCVTKTRKVFKESGRSTKEVNSSLIV